MKHLSPTLCIVIATRNRPEKLRHLLKSIMNNSQVPNCLSIVASGIDVNSIVREFEKEININYLFTPLKGQVVQRKLALESIDTSYDFYIFLDDDVYLDSDFISIFRDYSKNLDSTVGGIGLNLKIENSKKFKKYHFPFLQRLRGKVLSSGRAIPYLNSKSEISVKWLNGISAWRHSTINKFKHEEIENNYAAFEDVMFSYQVSKRHKLIFYPKLKVFEQENSKNSFADLEIYRTSWQHQLFFVLKYKNLSFSWFAVDFITSILFMFVSLIKGNFFIKNRIIKEAILFFFWVIRNRKRLLNDYDFKKILIKKLI